MNFYGPHLNWTLSRYHINNKQPTRYVNFLDLQDIYYLDLDLTWLEILYEDNLNGGIINKLKQRFPIIDATVSYRAPWTVDLRVLHGLGGVASLIGTLPKLKKKNL